MILKNQPDNDVWKKKIGWTALITMLCGWVVLWVLPFGGFSVKDTAIYMSVVFLINKVLLVIATYFLGKPYIVRLKNWVLRRKQPSESPKTTDNTENTEGV